MNQTRPEDQTKCYFRRQVGRWNIWRLSNLDQRNIRSVYLPEEKDFEISPNHPVPVWEPVQLLSNKRKRNLKYQRKDPILTRESHWVLITKKKTTLKYLRIVLSRPETKLSVDLEEENDVEILADHPLLAKQPDLVLINKVKRTLKYQRIIKTQPSDQTKC